jgi:L-ascorbate metabolism protein UlaG (beta-lactamase superfamily)
MNTELTSIPIEPSFFEPHEGTRVAWLGMAGVLINTHGIVILIDPLISYTESNGQRVSEEGYPLKVPFPIEAGQIPRADWVCYTHADDDHLGRLTAKTLAERLPCQFLAPPAVQSILQTIGIDPARMVTAHDYDVVKLGPVEIAITPALHNWQEQNPWQRGDCCGFLIKTPEGTLWHPGDTRLIDELLAVRDVDVLMFDVAAVDSHLGPEGSARLAETCGAAVMIPYHYGTFDLPPGSFGGCTLEDAIPYASRVAARFLPVNPGQVFGSFDDLLKGAWVAS